MTTSFHIGDLAKLAQNLLNKQQNGQEFMLLDVYRQTKEAYERFPEDPVIRQVAFVVEKMAEKAKAGAIISQSQVSKIHNEFVRLSENSKFKMVLGHLLLDSPTSSTSSNNDFIRTNRLDAVGEGIKTEDLVDKNLVNNFDVMLNGKGAIKTFDQKTAEKGAEYVKIELASLGFENSRVKILGGNEDTLIYTASFDTINGLVDVKIPIDLQNKQLIFPSTFIAEDHMESLTTANIKNFLDKVAKERNPNIDKRAEDIDLNAFDAGIHIAGTEQKAEMPKELAHLSRDFEDSLIEAASSFGKRAIDGGKQVVIRELVAAGFKNAQVKFGSETTDSVIYLASINTPKGVVEIEVPVEMTVLSNTYVPLMPTYFAYDGLVEDFTSAKLQRFAISLPAPSSKSVVYSSAYNYMLLPELKDEILKAASENDYITCETVLQHIEDKFSEEDHRNAIADYQFLLMTKAKMASKEQHVCKRMIPAGKTSIYDYCGCYNVPMNKVVADKDGNCILKSAVERQKLNPIDQTSVLISNSKINFT